MVCFCSFSISFRFSVGGKFGFYNLLLVIASASAFFAGIGGYFVFASAAATGIIHFSLGFSQLFAFASAATCSASKQLAGSICSLLFCFNLRFSSCLAFSK
jgi:hypothetical protein